MNFECDKSDSIALLFYRENFAYFLHYMFTVWYDMLDIYIINCNIIFDLIYNNVNLILFHERETFQKAIWNFFFVQTMQTDWMQTLI